ALYSAYASGRGKTRYGDKTPVYIETLGILERAFPGAQYLHIIRDGRDAALSFDEMDNPSLDGVGMPHGIAEFAWRWRLAVARARRFGEAHGRGKYREVFYERLVADPAATLRNICDFLGVDYVPEMMAYHRDTSRDALPYHPRLDEPPSPAARNWRKQMP